MRVLLIEDDAVIADLIRTVIADEGWTCETVPSAHDLPQEAFDVVVTDLVIGGAYSRAEAFAWLERLERAYPGTPVIVVTAHAAILADAAALPARRIVTKPFEIDELVAAIRDARPS